GGGAVDELVRGGGRYRRLVGEAAEAVLFAAQADEPAEAVVDLVVGRVTSLVALGVDELGVLAVQRGRVKVVTPLRSFVGDIELAIGRLGFAVPGGIQQAEFGLATPLRLRGAGGE